ncbi:MAG: hypothetical protein AB7O49_12275 [Sphingomonadales bacterium]
MIFRAARPGAVALLTMLALATGRVAPAAEVAPEALLPSYYDAYLRGFGLALVSSRDGRNGGRIEAYETADRQLTLIVDGRACESPECGTFLDNTLGYLNTRMTAGGGRFIEVTEQDFAAEFAADGISNVSAGYLLPGALRFWTFSAGDEARLPSAERLEALSLIVDRHRLDRARAESNVHVGHWTPQLRAAAEKLEQANSRDVAVKLLEVVLAHEPSDLKAHALYAEISPDRDAAATSAGIVFDNAESADLVARAAKVLDREVPAVDGLPSLRPGETGLQLVLVALPPCDLRLVEDAAALYAKSTGMPAKLVRLDQPWDFGEPDRVPGEKRLREMLASLPGSTGDFTGWTRERYAAELEKVAAGADALSRYRLRKFVADFMRAPGQYRVGPFVERLSHLLKPYRSGDRRTVYVGVTAANIYDGDLNYLFSGYKPMGGEGVSILSYAMMTAEATRERFETRQRLGERLAKEMIPAAFKQLDLPRPADPTDPYSYSSGTDRLDQKTLRLSQPTREALDRLR